MKCHSGLSRYAIANWGDWRGQCGLFILLCLLANRAGAATITLLGSFNGSNGANPAGSLTLVGSELYGMTPAGGADSDGVVFSIPVSGGNPSVIAPLSSSSGANPGGTLALEGSTFYGLTNSGGANGDGTIFSLPVSGGTPTVLASFNASTARLSDGSITLNGSTLYGMSQQGGVNDDGSVFSLPTSGGTPTLLGSFNITNGWSPVGSFDRGRINPLWDGPIGRRQQQQWHDFQLANERRRTRGIGFVQRLQWQRRTRESDAHRFNPVWDDFLGRPTVTARFSVFQRAAAQSISWGPSTAPTANCPTAI